MEQQLANKDMLEKVLPLFVSTKLVAILDEVAKYKSPEGTWGFRYPIPLPFNETFRYSGGVGVNLQMDALEGEVSGTIEFLRTDNGGEEISEVIKMAFYPTTFSLKVIDLPTELSVNDCVLGMGLLSQSVDHLFRVATIEESS